MRRYKNTKFNINLNFQLKEYRVLISTDSDISAVFLAQSHIYYSKAEKGDDREDDLRGLCHGQRD